MTFDRKADRTGRTINKPARSKVSEALGFPKGVGYCIPIPQHLIDSPAFRNLSLRARRVLDGVVSEWCAHDGHRNGDLIVPYDDLQGRGIRRDAILPAILELQALGLIAVQRGVKSYGSRRNPSKYRLTWLGTPEGLMATHEWKAIKTDDDALQRIEGARQRVLQERKARSKRSAERKAIASRDTMPQVEVAG